MAKKRWIKSEMENGDEGTQGQSGDEPLPKAKVKTHGDLMGKMYGKKAAK